jgi:2-methylisocitrate lyase-like PEP mutase family enzyme
VPGPAESTTFRSAAVAAEAGCGRSAGAIAEPAARRLRGLLAAGPTVEFAAVCDPLGARLAADAGFEAVALAGFAIGAHLPLTRSLSLADITRVSAAVAKACSVPVLVDADAGWGPVGGVPDAVRQLEAAGAASIQLSSQHLPDGVPFSAADERRQGRAELVERVRVAVRARDEALVMAAAELVDGGPADDTLPEFVAHCRALADAGADAVLVHSADAGLARLLPGALAGIALIFTGDPRQSCGVAVHDADRLQEWGYRGVRSKFHRCYCARLAGSTRGPGVPTPDR